MAVGDTQRIPGIGLVGERADGKIEVLRGEDPNMNGAILNEVSENEYEIKIRDVDVTVKVNNRDSWEYHIKVDGEKAATVKISAGEKGIDVVTETKKGTTKKSIPYPPEERSLLEKAWDRIRGLWGRTKTWVWPRDPIILDMEDNGLETVGLAANVYFDHDGDGVLTKNR